MGSSQEEGGASWGDLEMLEVVVLAGSGGKTGNIGL